MPDNRSFELPNSFHLFPVIAMRDFQLTPSFSNLVDDNVSNLGGFSFVCLKDFSFVSVSLAGCKGPNQCHEHVQSHFRE